MFASFLSIYREIKFCFLEANTSVEQEFVLKAKPFDEIFFNLFILILFTLMRYYQKSNKMYHENLLKSNR